MIDEELYVQAEDNNEILKESITKTLKYFHMFRFPLLIEEIHRFLHIKTTKAELLQATREMIQERKLFRKRDMYALENSDLIFLNRLVGSDVATEKLKEAVTSTKIVSNFPFVRCICISGSLSKGYADENSDIDFFIITAPKRLWICRTILHMFKKATFFMNQQHSFCMNYFIDESMLCIEEQNLFTATEVATLIPMYNAAVHKKLLQSNAAWMQNHFPNISEGNPAKSIEKTGRLKNIIERIINNLKPEKLNEFFMNLTNTAWRAKWRRKGFPMEEYDLAMKTKWYVSKQHPLNYQKKVLKHNTNKKPSKVALEA